MDGLSKAQTRAVGERFLTVFLNHGAQEVVPDTLLSAETLLDLYGEDIRARAYTTNDPVRGEMMLRPDFTVPVVQLHMQSGAEPARYCYLGEVFRKQDHHDTRPALPRPAEYLQVGFEAFDRDTTRADAEVFSLFYKSLAHLNLRAVTGDMTLLSDAIAGLPLSARQREALTHHIWRPRRFARLMSLYTNPPPRTDWPEDASPWIGARRPDDMARRMARLRVESAAPALSPEWADRFERLFSVRAPLPRAVETLRELVTDLPAIAGAVEGLAARVDAMAERGINPDLVDFDAGHGRAEMEYYDGFTFGFYTDNPDQPAVASGGRYDALTAVLGAGRAIPAVGGIIRPGLVAELEGQIC